MARRVLIIGSPLSAENFLVGVNHDVKNFYRYVTSATGGGHDVSEIRHLPNPTILGVQKLLNSVGQAEIFTVYFSGHGGRCGDADHVWLNEKELFPVTSFLTNAKRHIIITDSCRTPIDMRGIGDIMRESFQFPTDNLSLARNLHLSYLKNAPIGDAIIYSTSENMPSLDTEMGGVFTRSFMTVLQNWCYTQFAPFMTLDQMFKETYKITQEQNLAQKPFLHYNKTIDVIQFPIGINPNVHAVRNRSYPQLGSIAH